MITFCTEYNDYVTEFKTLCGIMLKQYGFEGVSLETISKAKTGDEQAWNEVAEKAHLCHHPKKLKILSINRRIYLYTDEDIEDLKQ